MELVIVRTEDVYPDENNPRQDFSGTEELAEGFWLNPERPGEPFQPPLLVRDGGIFRIYDGERRFRGIRHNKLDSFAANVCDDFEEADAMIAMLATNDKRPLSEIEESRGVQRMLRLGVDPVKVERAARIGSGKASEVKKAMELVDDAGEDMTLDRMYAVAEFADDREAVEEIMNCEERKWRYKVDSLRRERDSAERREALMAKLAELAKEGLVTAYTDEECAREDGYVFHAYKNAADELEEWAGVHGGGAATIDGNWVKLWVKGEPGRSEREALVGAEAEELVEHMGQLAEAARSWFASHLMAGQVGKLSSLEAAAREEFLTVWGDRPRGWADVDGRPLSAYDYVQGYECMEPRGMAEWRARRIVSKAADSYDMDCVLEWLDFTDLLESDGYERDEHFDAVRASLEAYRDAGGEDEGAAL